MLIGLYVDCMSACVTIASGSCHDCERSDAKKLFVKSYLKAQHFYSYDAASEDEDPAKRWIGREVTRFCEEAHIHLPVLLTVL